MPITWRNIDAPTFREGILANASAGQFFDRAASNLSGVVDDYRKVEDANWDNQSKINTNILIDRAKRAQDLNAFNADTPGFNSDILQNEYGVQFDREAVLAARAKQEAKHISDATGAAQMAGMTAFNASKSPVEANEAALKAATESGLNGQQALEAVANFARQSAPIQGAVIEKAKEVNTNKFVGRLTPDNLNAILKEASEGGNPYNEGVIRAAHAALLSEKTEGALQGGLSILGTTGDQRQAIQHIMNSGLGSGVISNALAQFNTMVKTTLTPTDQEILQSDIESATQSAKFNSEIGVLQGKAAELTKIADNLNDGKSVAAAALAAGSQGGVAIKTAQAMEETSRYMIFGKNKQDVANIIGATIRSVTSEGADGLTAIEADQAVVRALGNIAVMETSEFSKDTFNTEVRRIVDQTKDYKQKKASVDSLNESIKQDVSRFSDQTKLDELRRKEHLLKTAASGGSVKPFERTPYEIRSSKYFDKKGDEDTPPKVNPNESNTKLNYSNEDALKAVIGITHEIETKKGTIADNPNSQHVGEFQQGPQFWQEIENLTGKPYGKDDAKDPVKAAKATSIFYENAIPQLENHNIEVSPANLYTSYQQGLKGFFEIQKAAYTDGEVSEIRRKKMDANRPWVNGKKLPVGASPAEWLAGWKHQVETILGNTPPENDASAPGIKTAPAPLTVRYNPATTMNNMSNSAFAAVGRGVNTGLDYVADKVKDSARSIELIEEYNQANRNFQDGIISPEEHNKIYLDLRNKMANPKYQGIRQEKQREQEKTSAQVAEYNEDIKKMVAQLQYDARQQDATEKVIIPDASEKDVKRERQQIIDTLDNERYGHGGYELKRTGIEEMIRQNEARLVNETNPSQALINSVNIQRELLNRLKQKQE